MSRIPPRRAAPAAASIAVGIVALAALAALAFGGSLGGTFVWDDAHLIERNAAMRDPSGWRSILARDLWGQATDRPTQLYHPLPMLSFWAQAQLTGLRLWPLRLVNVLLHAGVVALALRWLARAGLPARAAWCAAAVLVVHPSVTEPVVWLTGRHDVLAAACVMAGLLAWPAATARRPAARAAASGVAFALAFLSKEPYVVAPALGLLVAAYERRRRPPGRAAPFVVPPLLACAPLAAAVGLRLGLGIPLSADRAAAPLGAHARAYLGVVAHYGLQLLSLGNDLTIAPYEPPSVARALAIAAALAIPAVALAWGAARRVGHLDLALLGLAWFLLALAPHVISVPTIGLYGNRYGYFALLGLATCVAACLASVPAPRRIQHVAVGAVGVVAVLAALATREEARAFRDNLTLFGRDVERAPDNGFARYHYGTAVLAAEGCAAALPLFVRAAEDAPAYPRPFHNVSGCALNLGQLALAATYGARAVALAPRNPGAHYNLGAALVGLGEAEAARPHLEAAVALHPGHEKARALLADLARAPRASGAAP